MPALNGLVVGSIIGGEQRNFCDMTQNHEVKMTSAICFQLYSMPSDGKTHIYQKHEAFFCGLISP